MSTSAADMAALVVLREARDAAEGQARNLLEEAVFHMMSRRRLTAGQLCEEAAAETHDVESVLRLRRQAIPLCLAAWRASRPHEERRAEAREDALEALHVAADAFAHYNPELGFSTIQRWACGIDDRAELDAAIVDLAERSTVGARCPKACSLALVALTRWRLFLDA